jgi:hypothetical protein
MAYPRTFWKDHVTERQNDFQHVDNGDGTIKHIPVPGTILQQGTPQNQPNFDNMEEGIFGATEMAAEAARSIRHHGQAIEGLRGEKGQITLTNSLEYPFNNSIKTVSLATPRNRTDYVVDVEVPANIGNVGRIEITDKLLNGFKIAFTGSAASVTLNYTVRGGM